MDEIVPQRGEIDQVTSQVPDFVTFRDDKLTLAATLIAYVEPRVSKTNNQIELAT